MAKAVEQRCGELLDYNQNRPRWVSFKTLDWITFRALPAIGI